MRVTQSEIYRTFISDIETANERVNRFSRQVSSGRRVTELKDDPGACAEMAALNKWQSDIEQYRYNMNAGLYFLSVADSALNEVNNLISSVYSKGSQAATETVSEQARATIAVEIRAFRDQIVSLANSQARGRHIFAGSSTSSAAFEQNGDSVTYKGDDAVNSIAIGNHLEVKQNIAGSEAFSPVFDAVENLLAGIDANDLGAIQQGLQAVSSALIGLGETRGKVGANLAMLENVKNSLFLQENAVKEQRSIVEDANMAEAIVQLKQAQSALQTTISAGGTILPQRNLFDILG